MTAKNPQTPASGQGATKVFMVYDVPEVNLPGGVDFEGLPGFDPQAHFNVRLPNPDLDDYELVSSQPEESSHDVPLPPPSTFIVEKEAKPKPRSKSHGKVKKSLPKASRKPSVTRVKHEPFTASKAYPHDELIIKEEEIEEPMQDLARRPKMPPEPLNWNPKTPLQHEYNQSTPSSSRYRHPLI